MKTAKIFLLSMVLLFGAVSVSTGQNTLLWEINGNGLQAPSYLYGTIHIKCPDQLQLSESIKAALEKSSQVVLELDMDDPAFMQEMQALSINEGMKNMQEEIAPEDLEVLNAYFMKHYGADMSQLGVLKPFVLLSMMFAKSLECPQPGSYEQVFITEAQKRNQEVLGLEELEDQIKIFDAVPMDEKITWLVGYAKDEDKFKSGMAKMLEAYDSQNVEQIHDLMKEFPEYRNIENELLYVRNKKWISTIESLASEKATFFAVGAAHLGSEEGVISLLRAKGYEVSPILE